MQYLKNADLTRLHGVSDKAVRNWIEASIQGKVNLDIVEIEGKRYIADSLHNDYVIEQLVQKGKKYHNKRTRRQVKPTADFYESYNLKQIVEIANSIDKYKEIPSRFRYFGKGATYWNAHLHKFYQSALPNMLTSTIQLLAFEKGYFDSLLRNHACVNVVDLGVGNGLAAKRLLHTLQETGKLQKYIGIDASEELLNVTARNITEWFDGKVKVELHQHDISHERFCEILADTYGKDASETINIVLLLGGTLGNFREPNIALQAIRESMNKGDILITSDELDGENARNFFGSAKVESFENVILRNKLILDLLGLDESFYSIEHTFDQRLKSHVLQARMRTNATISFACKSFHKEINLLKDEHIILFRMWEWNSNELVDLYERNGFSQLRITKLPNHEYVLLVSQVSGNARSSA